MTTLLTIIIVSFCIGFFLMGFYGYYYHKKAMDIIKEKVSSDKKAEQEPEPKGLKLTDTRCTKWSTTPPAFKLNVKSEPQELEKEAAEKLEQRILEESKRFPEVSFAKLSRIAKHFYDFGKQVGAKWMAEQGVTINGEILRYNGNKTIWFEDDSPLKGLQDFEAGDKVIVQIRKKED